ncbi:hypothetical protein CR513_46043, partial [Mucuna pruriens]
MSQQIQGSFPTQIESNQREEVKVITLKSGEELKEPQKIEKRVAPPKDEAPTKEILVHVIDKGKDGLTLKKKTNISIPFVEGIALMPNYANFF